MSPNRRADAGYAAGRRAKALQFLAAADEIMDLADDAAEIGDAYETLGVHRSHNPTTPTDTSLTHSLT